MINLGTKVIETERLILRKFTIEDSKYMFENWASDSEVTKYLAWPTHKTIDDSKEFIKFLINKYEEEDTYDWCIELKETKEAIGSIGVVNINKDVESVHIGYCIGKNWWHKGIVSEALGALIKFFMDEVKVNRIESRYDVRNIHSGEVMKKCGLKYEGTLLQSDKNNQGICDTAWYGLVRENYNKK